MTEHKQKLVSAVSRYEASRRTRDDAIRNAHASGLSYRAIAEITGMSHSRIQQIVTPPAPLASHP